MTRSEHPFCSGDVLISVSKHVHWLQKALHLLTTMAETPPETTQIYASHLSELDLISRERLSPRMCRERHERHERRELWSFVTSPEME